ncbi:MAG TPA: helix-turn-helix domain-containing protein [Treponemataceae bacterium]|nr:helix-turn-helix domain-containing protein [Treponemataceae bacterium]HPS44710.1 helix-turn-helix domain-containing protein [Treponemataceae bacterium]
MTGYENVRESIELFERSLSADAGGKPIKTVSELARRAGYSVYHFTRLFSAVANTHPKEYLAGRILSEAARQVAETDESLALIAERSGFPDYETFSRAFKRRFLRTPSAVRKERRLPSGLVPRLAPSLLGEPSADQAARIAVREPEVVEQAGFELTGLSFFIESGTVSFRRHWETFMKAQARVSDRVTPETYCQFSSWTDDEAVEGIAVLFALETAPGAAQEPLFTTRAVPRATYLKFTHEGDIASIGETYRYIFQYWFAARDDRPLDRWEFQRYREGATEIYIPMALR